MGKTETRLNQVLEGLPPLPLFVVLSGPSGVGKDSVVMRMRERGFPFHFVVTLNARPRRPGEVDGVDYHFVTAERFEELIAQGELLEWAKVYGQYRGIPRSEIRRALASGRDVILRVNVDGAATLKRLVPAAILIFIAPGSPEELRRRLEIRQTDSAEEIERRLAVARHEMTMVSGFDYVVINREDHLDEAVDQIRAIMTAEKHRVYPRSPVL